MQEKEIKQQLALRRKGELCKAKYTRKRQRKKDRKTERTGTKKNRK